MQATKRKSINKIWVAMSTPFQANFFAPLIKQLKNDYQFIVTARDHDSILRILEAKHINYIQVGRHGGKDLAGKLEAYAETIHKMLPIIKQEKPDLLLTERWPEAVRVAFGLDIPAWSLFYDEREWHVNRMVFPLCSKVFSPSFYSIHDLSKNGVTDQSKVVWFNGFHTCYLKSEVIDTPDPYQALGIKHPVVLVRPEPEFATFFTQHRPVLEETVQLLTENKGSNGKDLNVLVFPRTPAQAHRYSQIASVVDWATLDCPVAHADIVLGAAETMLMEAVTLCKPAVSSIYWTESKPVLELHKHIPHATDPKVLYETVQHCSNEDEQRRFSERMKLVMSAMDNPVDIMINSIHEADEDNQSKARLSARRSQLEKCMDVVQATAMGPVKPTRVMKLANVPHSEFKHLAKTLEQRGLIGSESTFSGKYYRATSYGLQLLQDYQGIKSKLLDI